LIGKRLHVTAAASDLHHLIACAPDQVAGKDLRARCLESEIRSRRIGERCKHAKHRVTRVNLRRELRELPLRDLEMREGVPELNALLGIPGHLAKNSLRPACTPRG